MQRFFRELKRRNVIRAGIAYLAGCWLLVQILETLLPIFGLPESSIRWFVVALGVGLVPVLVVSWAFEWTSEGFKADTAADPSTQDGRRRGRRFDAAIIVVLAIAVGYFAIDKFVAGRAGAAPDGPAHNTIAVLPFMDLSPRGDHAYFSDGIAEELLDVLTSIPELRVASRTSSFSFKGKDASVTEIAQALNVAHVLEGSVRKSGDRLRITAQLISARDGFHLWSRTYDRPLGDIFEIQQEISTSIVDALKLVMLDGAPRIEKTSPEAFALYLQGRYLDQQGSPESMTRAVEHFRQALELDPAYASAWVAMATTMTNQTSQGLRPWDEGYAEARKAILTALKIDPDHAGAYSQLSWIANVYDADLSAAAAHAQRALALQPTDPTLIGNAAVLMQSLGRLGEAIALHEYSLARTPVDPRAHYNLGLAYYFDDRLEDAERSLRKVLSLSAGYGSARYRLGTILLLGGDIDGASRVFAQEEDEAYRVKGRALIHHARGEQVEADATLAEFTRRWGRQWPSEVAQIHAYRNERDAAFGWLEKSYEIEGPAGWGEWRLMRLYDNLRADPRWQRYLRKVGVSDQQLAAIRFDVRAPEDS